ncbi:hypothetical protein LJR290_004038 [Variovorax sp. LjRoot290]
MPTQLLCADRIHRQDRAGRIDDEVHRGIGFEGRSPLLLEILPGLLGPLVLRDVGIGREDRHRLALLVSLQCQAARHDHRRSVSPVMHQLAFPASGAQHLRFDLLERHGGDGLQQLGRGLAERLFSRPSIHLLGAAVPVLDRCFHVAHEHGVVREIQQVGVLAQRGFDLPLERLTRRARQRFVVFTFRHERLR